MRTCDICNRPATAEIRIEPADANAATDLCGQCLLGLGPALRSIRTTIAAARKSLLAPNKIEPPAGRT